MSRAIKFRAWDKRSKLMSGVYEPFRYYVEGVDDSFVFQDCEIPINSSDLEIMQYTGLKDKNGKEIYEGDIVSGRFGINTFVIPQEMKMLHTGGASNMSCYGWDFNGYDATQVEVIGNIFENPELLKSK
jgi:uncharacterized phage protein (TIGR01671 family)